MKSTTISYSSPYMEFDQIQDLPYQFVMEDHLGGFDACLENPLFRKLQNYAQYNDLRYEITLYQVVTPELKAKYPNLALLCDFRAHDYCNFRFFHDYTTHPEIAHDHFVCSFNGSAHVSRQLLVSILHRFGWFDTMTCSKNFSYSSHIIDGHIEYFVTDSSFYRKFFISDIKTDGFFTSINSFGHEQYNHSKNIYNLEHKLTSSFLHIVSESLSTSYYPFVTEKFLYSIVTRGLFLAYAQPGWHAHLEKYYGFRRYSKIFDYRFDEIKNPVERLVELMSSIAKFSVLSSDDWRDLYEMEIDTIEYNYEHYFSKNYLKHLEQFS